MQESQAPLLTTTESQPEPLRHRTARAGMVSGGAEVVTRVLTVALSIATARALEPGEVGALALAVIVIGIVSVVASYAETAAIVSRSEASDGQYAFAAALIRGAITVVLLTTVVSALPVTTRLLAGKEGAVPQLAALVSALMWQPALELAASYPRVILLRQLDLTYLAWVNLIQVVSHVGLSVALLWSGYGAMGVVWSSLITAALTALLLWFRVARSRMPRGSSGPSKRVWRQIALETANIFSGGFIGYINMRLDNLLVAAALGPTGMSFYSMAWNASRAPVMVLSTAFSSVLMPTMARIQSDGERLKRAVSESLQHSYILLAPVSMAMFLYAGTIVPVVLGAKWTPMVPCLQVMAITILVAPLLYAWQALFIVSRRAYLTSIPAIVHIVLLALLMVPVTRWKGLVGAAFIDMIGASMLTLTGIVLSSRLRATLTWPVLCAVFAPIGAAVVSGLLGYAVGYALADGIGHDTLRVGVALLAYPIALVLFGGRNALWNTVGLFRAMGRPGMSWAAR